MFFNISNSYRHRKEWSDVQPIKQFDGPNPVVAIAYSERCELYCYLDKVYGLTAMLSLFWFASC